MTESRRFPPPWSVEETHVAYRILDGNGRETGVFVRWPTTEAIGSTAARHPTKDEARRIAANIAKLPDLLAGRRGLLEGPKSDGG